MRAAAVLALAVALVGPGMAPTPAFAATRPSRGRHRRGPRVPGPWISSSAPKDPRSSTARASSIGPSRMRASCRASAACASWPRGYMRCFVARGLFTKDDDKARRATSSSGTRASTSASTSAKAGRSARSINPWGVSTHSLHGIHLRVDYFLHVDWSNGDGPGDPGNDNGNNGNNGNNPPDDPGAGPGNGDSTGNSTTRRQHGQ